MQSYTFTATVEKGRLVIGLRALKALHAAVFGWRACPVTVTVEKRHATRSSQANRYYFGVCLKHISDYTGYTVDEVHDWAKARFIPKHVAICDKNGEIKDDLVIGGTTRKLNSLQFYEYLEAIRKFAAEELDLNIPDPDPDWREDAA